MSRRNAIAVAVLLAQLFAGEHASSQSPGPDFSSLGAPGHYEQLEREMLRMQAEMQALRMRVASMADGNSQSKQATAAIFADNDDAIVQEAREPLPALTAGYAQPAQYAAPTAAPVAYVNANSNFDAILNRLDALEQNNAKAAAPKKADDGWTDLSGEKWTVKLGGHVQADYILWADKDPNIDSPLARNYFEFRRLRLVADGTGYGVYDFRLQMTVEPENVGQNPNIVYLPTIKDAYLSMNEIPAIGRLRFGNFFVPFGLEQVTNDTNTVFLERAIPAQGTFTGGREVGIAQYNHVPDYNLSWASGFFFDNIGDTGIDRTDNNQGYRISGRVSYLPYYDEPSNGRYLVYTGAGVLYTHDNNQQASFRARPDIHTGPFLIDTGNIPAEHFTIGNVEFATVLGPLCVQSEFYYCDIDTNATGNQPLYGAYAFATYSLTGENRNFERFGQHGAQFGRATPFSNMFCVPGCHSIGGFELKARWSTLDFTSVGSGQYNDLTVGFNWYWSDRIRMLFDYIHPVTAEGTTPYGETVSDLIAMRLDFNW